MIDRDLRAGHARFFQISTELVQALRGRLNKCENFAENRGKSQPAPKMGGESTIPTSATCDFCKYSKVWCALFVPIGSFGLKKR